jgi:hypothetical protein
VARQRKGVGNAVVESGGILSPSNPVVGVQPMTAEARKWIEVPSKGLDEELQTVAGDPYGGLSSVGLRVPTLPSERGRTSARYLNLLAGFTVPEGVRVRIHGYRQLVTIGYLQPAVSQNPPRVNEFQVTSPFFKFPDGNISWHLMRMGMNEPLHPLRPGLTRNMSLVTPGPPLTPLRNLAWKMSDTPALLFSSVQTPNFDPFYVNLTQYQAPNSGRPWGRPVTSGLGCFYDLRTQWRESQAWSALDIPIEGPTRVAFFASVAQTNPQNRAVLTAPPNDPSGASFSLEERFILNNPNAIYWRVGGALIVSYDDEEM